MDFSGTGTANIYEDVSYGNHLCTMSDNLMYTSQKNSKMIKIKTVPSKEMLDYEFEFPRL